MLQGRLTLVRYNNEPQFFLADANVFFGLIVDLLERARAHADGETIDEETLTRLKDAVALVERRMAATTAVVDRFSGQDPSVTT